MLRNCIAMYTHASGGHYDSAQHRYHIRYYVHDGRDWGWKYTVRYA